MSEVFQDIRNDGLAVETCIIDRSIGKLIDEFAKTMSEGSEEQFQELKYLDGKVGHACLIWALEPTTGPKSIELRSLHIVKQLVDQYRTIEAGSSWPYTINLAHKEEETVDYSRQVYTGTEAILRVVISSELGLQPQQGLVDFDDQRNLKEELIVAGGNKAILKKEWLYPGTDVAHMAAFVVKAV